MRKLHEGGKAARTIHARIRTYTCIHLHVEGQTRQTSGSGSGREDVHTRNNTHTHTEEQAHAEDRLLSCTSQHLHFSALQHMCSTRLCPLPLGPCHRPRTAWRGAAIEVRCSSAPTRLSESTAPALKRYAYPPRSLRHSRSQS